MAKIEFGDKIIVNRFYRRSFDNGKRIWANCPYPVHNGIFLGYRTIQEGWREWEYSNWIFIPTDYLRVALVSPGPTLNPIYVPIDSIT